LPASAGRFALSGDGDEDFLGAVNGSCPAAFALILLGIGFAALGFRAAGEAKAGIIEAGELALDGVGDAFGGDRGVNVREVISGSCARACAGVMAGMERVLRERAIGRARPGALFLRPGSPDPGFALPLPALQV
jgi:hypothetical protein